MQGRSLSIQLKILIPISPNRAFDQDIFCLWWKQIINSVVILFCFTCWDGHDATEEGFCASQFSSVATWPSKHVKQKKLPLHYFLICFYHITTKKKIREKSRECHNHTPQPFPDPKRKRKPTNPNKHKSNKRTKSTKISSLFPKRGNRNTKRTEKHKNKMTHGKTYNKSPLRLNHRASKNKTNTGTTALERSVE